MPVYPPATTVPGTRCLSTRLLPLYQELGACLPACTRNSVPVYPLATAVPGTLCLSTRLHQELCACLPACTRNSVPVYPPAPGTRCLSTRLLPLYQELGACLPACIRNSVPVYPPAPGTLVPVYPPATTAPGIPGACPPVCYHCTRNSQCLSNAPCHHGSLNLTCSPATHHPSCSCMWQSDRVTPVQPVLLDVVSFACPPKHVHVSLSTERLGQGRVIAATVSTSTIIVVTRPTTVVSAVVAFNAKKTKKQKTFCFFID